MSGRPSESRCFNENSPRPPVPGEERDVSIRSISNKEQKIQQQSGRLLHCDASSSSCNPNAPQGYEPEGRCEETTVMEEQHQQEHTTSSNNSELACLQWSRSLHALLEDPKGLELFEQYLQQEGHIYALYFWFACEGLKEEHDPSKLTAIIKVLVRRFFQRPQLALPNEIRKELARRFREGLADRRTFDLAQREVERLIEETTYPNFLRSDVYLQYVRRCQQNSNNQSQSESDSEIGSPVATDTQTTCASNLLPTLHEDSELSIQQRERQQQQQLHAQQVQLALQQQHQNEQYHQQQQQQHKPHTSERGVQSSGEFTKGGEVRLTKDMLIATQQLRAFDVRPKPEAYAGMYLQASASPYHASVSRPPRAHYSSYNPVSRQDSELQSLSSDARTESDNLSLTDASLDGASISRRNNRKQYIRQYRQIKNSAILNRDPAGHETIIPRTQRVSREQTQPMKPESFAKQLIEKLERVKRDRENEEKLDRKLKEVDMSTCMSDVCDSSVMSSAPAPQTQSRSLADALRDKLQSEEDSDQAILDQHVSRVWSDLTPSRSPKLSSPRPRSPDKSRRQQAQQQRVPTIPPPPPPRSSQRKEKDVFSTFSGDSGNVHDFPEAGELHGAGSMSSLGSHHLPKSKSVPSDYADSLYKQDVYFPGQDSRYRRLEGGARSSATKKSMTELTDSGVSVVSDVPPAAIKDSRLINWLKDTDNVAGSGCSAGRSELKHRSKRFANLPQQPFVGDPGMPLLPQPHTATQLEEAKRRLEYEQTRSSSRQRYPSQCSKQQQQQLLDYDSMSSATQHQSSSGLESTSQSTLRRSRQETSTDFTTVVFSFCEEKFPYRTKIAGYNITLKQFKEVLPKKGNYRYFFKTECEDLDMAVIQEEITDDAEILPLWEGKIMAQVKALE